MVNSFQVVAHFLNLWTDKHYLVQFLAKLWASTAKMKGVMVLQTFRQSQNESICIVTLNAQLCCAIP